MKAAAIDSSVRNKNVDHPAKNSIDGKFKTLSSSDLCLARALTKQAYSLGKERLTSCLCTSFADG